MERLDCNLHESDQTCDEGADASYDDDGMCKASPGAARREAIRLEARLEAAWVHDSEAWAVVWWPSREELGR
jgi:hypothetical protein